VSDVYLTALSPFEVAREVEAALQGGSRRFVLRRVNGGGMVDRERLGAARYAAGLQSVVELEDEPAAIAAAR
jgi:hypothetical protein